MNAFSVQLSRTAKISLLAGLLGGLMAGNQHAQLLGGGGLLEGGSTSSGSTGSTTTYRGQARVVAGALVGTGILGSDTRPLDSSGGVRATSAPSADHNMVVMAEAGDAVTFGADNAGYSEAAGANA